ncbi:extracellular solute-binding protein [Ornithinimicrobium pekingense]|uniref:Sugar ABC transporter substrate-binding protein n=1 Tax=Ornithinimicrobium pekingense TaxID=384677 RepID=A0ABQ2FBE3_9MICO|nr:extracellular solute-binding protein [Ornithinimicrobium pekingense]GGK80192.1 sugar ABC transporter substrate-binding protein [Ornithinimicrobium pekingense]
MTRRTSPYLILAAATATSLVLGACGDSSDATDEEAAGSGGEVSLTVATFNEFGYEELLEEYEELNPGVTVEHVKADTADNARAALRNSLGANSGAADIEAMEVDWVTEFKQYPDKFADLSDPEVEGRWLDWKTEAVTLEDGTLMGYGTDIGPEAVCYRADLFEEAGLPTDREEVAELLGESWEDYFAAGREFVATSDAAWYDSAGALWQGMINQVDFVYEDADNNVVATTNPQVRELYDQVLAASVDDELSAGLGQWSSDWSSAFQEDEFATMLCPGWMLGVIEGNAEGVEGWDIANTFPGGGGNWGGSYLTVPAQGDNIEEATKLAAWLTAPEQQLKAFESKGTFPSQVEALGSDTLLGSTNAFFNDAPTGEILAERAEAVTMMPHKGPKYFEINTALQDAITRVDVDGTDDPDSSWDKFVAAVEALG